MNSHFHAGSVTPGIVTIAVEGIPKPKGSLKHVGRGRLTEQVAGSKPWRARVAAAALAQHRGGPLTGPIRVDFELRITPPKSAPKRRLTWPITRSSGDVDKHARNIFDALVDGRVLADDAQVVEVRGRKRHCVSGEAPGAMIHVEAVVC